MEIDRDTDLVKPGSAVADRVAPLTRAEGLPAKEIPFKDENSGKGRTTKGDTNQMDTITSVSDFGLAKSQRLQKDRATLELSPGLIDRRKLESSIYWLLKMSILASLLTILHYSFGFTLGALTLITAIVSVVSIRLLSSFKIPTNNLVFMGHRSAGAKVFLSNELKFALILTSVVFFSGLNLNPMLFGLFLAGNFCLQSLLFIIRQRYNRTAARIHQKRGTSKSEKKVIIVGASTLGKKAADLILECPELDIRILGFIDHHKDLLWRYRDIPLLGHLGELDGIISRNQVDSVVMAIEQNDSHYSQDVFNLIEEMGIDICVLPDIHRQYKSRRCVSSMNGQPVVLYHSARESGLESLLKDMMDKTGALVGLIISAPILLISALAIKIDSRGPVFFKQVRLGKNGKTFEMYKLRTMVNGADEQKEKLRHLNEMSGPVFKIENDPRITSIGKILRKFSIDEFPQFFNILKGDMSLVGPRPALPDEVAHYKPWQRRKLSVKPGATCLWQINGRNHIDFSRWVELDLEYIDRRSLKEDARILLKTFPAVLKGKGAS